MVTLKARVDEASTFITIQECGHHSLIEGVETTFCFRIIFAHYHRSVKIQMIVLIIVKPNLHSSFFIVLILVIEALDKQTCIFNLE